MNKVILVGRLIKDVDFNGNGDSSVARFNLAVDRRYKKDGEQNADFINCVSFGKTAQFLEKYGKKGTKFVLEGRIQTGSYTNKDGQKVYTTDVVAEHVEFAESKSNGHQVPAAASPDTGFMTIPDGIEEELPFM